MRPLALAAGTVLLSALAALGACGPVEERRCLGCDYLCQDVVCRGANEYVACDPSDGLCKCGPPELGLVCGDGEVCTPLGENAFACLLTRCELVTCDRGQRCEISTGACVCGEGRGAPSCADFQTCEAGRCVPESRCDGVTCDGDAVCDPADGVCRCAGLECGIAERCLEGTCTYDPCFGVNCPAGAVCSAGDGLCHCGDEAGAVCLAGQACDGRACVGFDPCAGVTCGEGAVCDPTGIVAVCRCGGVGAEFPECSGPSASCWRDDRWGWRCTGGSQGDACFGRDCDAEVPGSSCDPEDGRCKCGGLDGVLCEGNGLACAVDDTAQFCTSLCDPLADACPGEEACTYEAARRIALCRLPGESLGRTCRGSSECTPGAYCARGDGDVCREVCDLDPPPGQPDGCPAAKSCSPLPGSPYPRLGHCLGTP